MFGITIVGCVCFRIVLSRLNKKLEAQQQALDAQPEMEADIMNQPDEALRMQKGFRYLV